MTPEYQALRDAVARAMNEAALKARTENPDIPDEEYDAAQAAAALATVRAALREPTRIKTATGFGIPTTTAVDIWRAMLAASALGGPGHE